MITWGSLHSSQYVCLLVGGTSVWGQCLSRWHTSVLTIFKNPLPHQCVSHRHCPIHMGPAPAEQPAGAGRRTLSLCIIFYIFVLLLDHFEEETSSLSLIVLLYLKVRHSSYCISVISSFFFSLISLKRHKKWTVICVPGDIPHKLNITCWWGLNLYVVSGGADQSRARHSVSRRECSLCPYLHFYWLPHRLSARFHLSGTTVVPVEI